MSKVTHLSHQLAQKMETAEKILLVFGAQTSSLDQVAAATALYVSLKERNPDKVLTLLSFGEPVVEQVDLVGINKAVTKLPVAGTVIALQRTKDQIKKISCDTDETTGQVAVVVENMPQMRVLTKEEMILTPMSENYDIVLSFCGARHSLLKKMGVNNMTPDNTFLFSREKMVDNEAIENIYPEHGSFSGLVAELLRQWAWQIDVDAASNLLLGLDARTRNFTNGDTEAVLFELAGWLLRAGGQRSLAQTQRRREKVRNRNLSP
ncbi:hypothetical protein FWH30_02690 [Microgenomates group bacterium]|nr:hypothetical protein [Microgenomates group bacterium]